MSVPNERNSDRPQTAGECLIINMRPEAVLLAASCERVRENSCSAIPRDGIPDIQPQSGDRL